VSAKPSGVEMTRLVTEFQVPNPRLVVASIWQPAAPSGRISRHRRRQDLVPGPCRSRHGAFEHASERVMPDEARHPQLAVFQFRLASTDFPKQVDGFPLPIPHAYH
jgi:hypothetical protein